MAIKDVKNQFLTQEAYQVYSDCMYQPTWEKFCARSKELVNDDSVNIYGYLNENKIVGIIAIKSAEGQTAEIKGIAVDPTYRKQGIGQQLIQFVAENTTITKLFAETDDDAILFYKHCGFTTEAFYISIDNRDYRRYKCSRDCY